MTDYERGYEQGKADATSKMHPEIRKCLEDYFDECFTEYKADRKPWVGLTDEEIQEIMEKTVANCSELDDLTGDTARLFWKNCEVKSKEKNR